MKARRQMKILEIINTQVIETQEELARCLKEHNIGVTQATVSRDIKELQLAKVPVGDGRYRYAQPDDPNLNGQSDRMLRIFRECILGMDYSDNLLVLSTLPATAAAVAEAVDGLRWKEVIGTLAGERTVFIACKPRESAPQLVDRIYQLMR